jgi:hypothetical protein
MPVTPEELEAGVRAAIEVTYMKVEDNSGSCGDNYSILIVSKVACPFPAKVGRSFSYAGF